MRSKPFLSHMLLLLLQGKYDTALYAGPQQTLTDWFDDWHMEGIHSTIEYSNSKHIKMYTIRKKMLLNIFEAAR